MRVEERDLGFGVVEQRTYDEDGKLMDVRKIYPSVDVRGVNPIKLSHGTAGGHDHT